MPRIVKNTLLNYIPQNFEVENFVNPVHVFDFNNKPIQKGKIVYLCEREIRVKDNFSLQFALQKSKELNLPLKIIHPKINYEHLPKEKFIIRQLIQVQQNFTKLNLDFEIIDTTPQVIIKTINPALLIIDFNPILNRAWLKNVAFKVIEIDGHNIVPARYVSDKQEYSAATIRAKIYHNIYPFLSEFNNLTTKKVEADYVLEEFIKSKLANYAKFKNNPSKNILSGLSKYLNLGFISSQRVAIDVIKSGASAENKEAFLEALIVRKELADNFCLYNKRFKSFKGIPSWAKNSLECHKEDFRPYIYTMEELESATTHDNLWNATQNQLKREGIIHGYLRMYWAKKILEWTISADVALKIAIYLNDKYAYDAPSANGYVGILWAIGGLHDRAFTDYPVTGKIRRMTYQSIKQKYDLDNYLKKMCPNDTKEVNYCIKHLKDV